ncbi:MAG: envelope stress response membrane protein PspC [Deltaproteobacteria bacterium]|nr:envelope stress response membrane protein PspC [Deltaproteobacteria bacterium]MBW2283790.1 envelope stress response membrane protein PspC [Deltaproteobacteria bacterium]
MRRLDDILQGGLYRSRNGVILGVIRGLAEYFDFSVFWARVIAVVLLLVTGFWPVTGLYFLGALLMKPQPVLPIDSDEEQEFYDSYVSSRRRALDRLKRRYDSVERRIRRMEDTVTSRDFDWESRLNT